MSKNDDKIIVASIEKIISNKLLNKDFKISKTKAISKIFKRDLMNYIIYLNLNFPTMFMHHKTFTTFFNNVQRKTKAEIVDVINYYADNKNINQTPYEIVIKGTSNPELVNVNIKKEVKKII